MGHILKGGGDQLKKYNTFNDLPTGINNREIALVNDASDDPNVDHTKPVFYLYDVDNNEWVLVKDGDTDELIYGIKDHQKKPLLSDPVISNDDERTLLTKKYIQGTEIIDNANGILVPNLSQGAISIINLSGDVIINSLNGITEGKQFKLIIKQDVTGTHNVTLGSAILLSGNLSSYIEQGDGATTIFEGVGDGDNVFITNVLRYGSGSIPEILQELNIGGLDANNGKWYDDSESTDDSVTYQYIDDIETEILGSNYNGTGYDGYHVMKSFIATKTESITLAWDSYIQSGTWYYGIDIRVNGQSQEFKSWGSNISSGSIHVYHTHRSSTFNVNEGERITLHLRKSTSPGADISHNTGTSQNLYVKNFRAYSLGDPINGDFTFKDISYANLVESNCLRFTGNTSYVDYGQKNDFVFGTNDFKIIANVYITAVNGWCIIAENGYGVTNGFRFYINGNRQIAPWVTGLSLGVGSDLVPLNQWVEVSIRRESGQIISSINGKDENLNVYNGNIGINTRHLLFGADVTNGWGITGKAVNFEVENNGNTVIKNSFSEGIGNIVHDISVSNNHGTMNGAIWENQDYYHRNLRDGFSNVVPTLNLLKDSNHNTSGLGTFSGEDLYVRFRFALPDFGINRWKFLLGNNSSWTANLGFVGWNGALSTQYGVYIGGYATANDNILFNITDDNPHTYEIERISGNLSVYVDGTLIETIVNNNPLGTGNIFLNSPANTAYSMDINIQDLVIGNSRSDIFFNHFINTSLLPNSVRTLIGNDSPLTSEANYGLSNTDKYIPSIDTILDVHNNQLTNPSKTGYHNGAETGIQRNPNNVTELTNIGIDNTNILYHGDIMGNVESKVIDNDDNETEFKINDGNGGTGTTEIIMTRPDGTHRRVSINNLDALSVNNT